MNLEGLANFFYGAGAGAIFWGFIFEVKGQHGVADNLAMLGRVLYLAGFVVDIYRGKLKNSGNSSSRYMSDSGNRRSTRQV